MTEEPQDEIEQLELLRRIRAQAQVDGSRITLARDVLADAFAADLRGLVDEAWYLDRYPDVADAVGRGMLGSGADHYLQAGIYEGRMPYRVRLDSADYLETHPDVESSIQEGAFRSALDHFVRAGFAEGRAFTLASPEPEDPQTRHADRPQQGAGQRGRTRGCLPGQDNSRTRTGGQARLVTPRTI